MGVLVTAVIVLAILLGMGALFRFGYVKQKKQALKPYGKLVEVKDGTMHVYAMGSGEKKIVLLPGLGIPLPSADFSPLMRTLSNTYTVICIEYFGVGFSSGTSRSRTSEHYVEEIREALQRSGYAAPYVFMAHSLSSIYSEYYASKYPEEVEAVVSLDGTSSAYYEKTPKIVSFVLPLASYMQILGLMPALALLTTNRKKLRSYGYTKKEINDSIIFSGFSLNKTCLEQMIQSSEHVKQVMDVPFPDSVPYLKIIAGKTWETRNRQLKITPQEYQQQHLARIGPHAQHSILEGNHFIYLNNSEAIAEMTDQLLKVKN